jgi:hypothetical protein
VDVSRLTREQLARLEELKSGGSFLDRFRGWSWSDLGHTALDIGGFFPGVGEAADVANAAWYVGEGEYLDAGLSLISIIPVLGDVIGKGGRLATRLGPSAARRILQALEKVDVIRYLDRFADHPKLGKHIRRIQEAVQKWIDDIRASSTGAPSTGAVTPGRTVTQIPSVAGGEFARWFDSLSPAEFDEIWAVPELRNAIKRRLRSPGGYHEWLPVSRAPVFKRWGITAEQMAAWRSKIVDVKFINPEGLHGATGSTTAHNEIFRLIEEAADFDHFKRALQEWADRRLVGGAGTLPSGLAP